MKLSEIEQPKNILVNGKIKELYLVKELSIAEIAKLLSTTDCIISHRLHEMNCMRSQTEGCRLYHRKHPMPIGKNSRRWTGGRYEENGYVLIWVSKGRYVFEHVLVWEQVHNKPLPKGLEIRHLNGIRNDNRPCNLVAISKAGHTRIEQGELYKKRIRELEMEVKLLEKALNNSQMIFRIEEN